MSDSGVVDQDVQTAIFGFQVVSQANDAFFIIDIELAEFRVESLTIQLFNSCNAPIHVPRRQIHDAMKFGTQFFNDGKSNAFVRSSYLLPGISNLINSVLFLLECYLPQRLFWETCFQQ